MAKTRADLVAQAGSNLGVSDAYNPLTADEYDAIDEHYDGIKEELSALGIYQILSDDDIPLEVFSSLSDYLAEDAAPDFGRPTNPAVVEAAKAKLRKMTYSRPSYQPYINDDF